ncbi:GNAT family N-acetyltransferase [Microbacterium profundi]|uniref:GNAT family N-acetyltransferase n=1 Tax=Microbacterium profundi TaxID=450380 RepID=UPI0035591FC2
MCCWKTTWRDQDVFEAGWFIVPEAQGRGAGSAAVKHLIDDTRAHVQRRRLLTAFPDEHNAPSNDSSLSGACRHLARVVD